MRNRIVTNIKFYKGLDNVADKLYGFVTKVDGSWRGCRDTEKTKKIVFVDSAVAGNILPNVLYSCSLIPMTSGNGFIAKSATVVKFAAKIITTTKNDVFMIKVVFGNKTIVYDPSSHETRRNSIQLIADMLRSRLDLKNAPEVAEDFITSASAVKRLYLQSQNVQ